MSEENKNEEVKNEEATPADAEAKADKPAEEKKEEVKEEASTEAPAEDASEEVEVPEKFKAIVDSIESMTVLDLHELVKLLEKKFGVSAQAVAVAGGGAGDAGASEEKSSFTVELADAGAQKIAVIKVVKATLGLGLKEAKDLVESAPAVLKEGASKEEAEDIKKQIEEAGGSVNLK